MADQFKVLSERDHIRTRPNMYIGSTSPEELTGIINFKYQTKMVVPGLIKIIEEIYQNSVDEAIRTDFKFANTIDIKIEHDFIDGWYVQVKDNGRGIPMEQHGGVYQAELSWTRARAGSNFDDSGRVTIGMNGVGSFATNCFSTKFVGTTCDGKQQVHVECFDGCNVINTDVSKSKDKGTTVKFYPDLTLFNVDSITDDIIDVIKDRLYNLSICYPKIKFTFNDEILTVKNASQLAKQFSPHALSLDADNYNIVIAPAGDDEEFRHTSYFNGISIKNGGNHIDFFVVTLCNELIPMIKKKWKIEVQPNQIKQHLLLGFWVRSFPNPKFDSQSKERITNTWGEIKNFLDIDFTKLAKRIIATDDIIMPAIESIIRKKEAIEKREATLAQKKAKKAKIVNHIAANSKNFEEKIIYCAEGLSAAGLGIETRNPLYHGFYALRGKVLNTHGMSAYDILKNKELNELSTIIGLDFDSSLLYEDPSNLYRTTLNDEQYIVGINDVIRGVNASILDLEEIQVNDKALAAYKSQNNNNIVRQSGESKLNYGKIACLQDMDPDGNAIFCLLLLFFSRWPDLFNQGRVLRVQTPLYVAKKKGKKTIYYYTFDEYEKREENLSGYDVSYIKGLGSLEKEDYKETVIDNPRFTIITLDDISKLDMAFGKSADGRKDWMLD